MCFLHHTKCQAAPFHPPNEDRYFCDMLTLSPNSNFTVRVPQPGQWKGQDPSLTSHPHKQHVLFVGGTAITNHTKVPGVVDDNPSQVSAPYRLIMLSFSLKGQYMQEHFKNKWELKHSLTALHVTCIESIIMQSWYCRDLEKMWHHV